MKTGLKSHPFAIEGRMKEKDDESLFSLSAEKKGALSVLPYAFRH